MAAGIADLGAAGCGIRKDHDGVHRQRILLVEPGKVPKHPPSKGSLWLYLVLEMDEESGRLPRQPRLRH